MIIIEKCIIYSPSLIPLILKRSMGSDCRLADQGSAISEQTRKRDEAMHTLEILAREKEHNRETETAKIQGKIAEIAEEVSKKIMNKEIKLREEAQTKYAQIEKVSTKIANFYFSLCSSICVFIK